KAGQNNKQGSSVQSGKNQQNSSDQYSTEAGSDMSMTSGNQKAGQSNKQSSSAQAGKSQQN
ncbi:hypothetical protein, partial [Domibacillus robiginosus]|uniref:hypothetical protein n=1 Tax=Domibacillus robiginosus TaxID=1071054 RepID=UPI001C10F2BB